mgnify:CR=1 FL=1
MGGSINSLLFKKFLTRKLVDYSANYAISGDLSNREIPNQYIPEEPHAIVSIPRSNPASPK